jgi:carbon-monoxide dehydrogenase medium subunit
MLHVGATCTYATLIRSPEIEQSAPLLRLMARGVTGGPQIRNRGTLGGSVAAARAGFDASTALSAACAAAVVWGADGERRVGMTELLRGEGETSLDHDEVITGFEISLTQESPSVGYRKLKRSESSWPIVTAAAMVWQDGAADVTSARIAVGGLDAVPVVVRLDSDELAADDRRDLLRSRLAERLTVPFEDVLAPHWYRASVAPVAAQRALADAMGAPDGMSVEARR